MVGIRENVHAKTYWPIAEVTAAANHLEPMVLKYAGNIENEPYNDESTYIHAFLAKLSEPEWQHDIEVLDFRPLVDYLFQTQQNFESVQRNRALDAAAKSEIAAASNKRRDLERTIRAFVKYAEAMEMTTANSVWHALNLTIKQQLTEIERGYRTTTKQSQSEINKE